MTEAASRRVATATDEGRRTVIALATCGIPRTEIAKVMGIPAGRLVRLYQDELDLSKTKANATIADCLYQQAIKGNITAQIFWLKCQAKWRETAPLDAPLAAGVKQILIKVVDGAGGA